MTPLPELILYSRAGCHLCEEARDAITLVIEDRTARNLASPRLVEVDIETDPTLHRALFDRIPVVELGDRRVELVVTVGRLRRLLNEAVGDAPIERAKPEAEPANLEAS